MVETKFILHAHLYAATYQPLLTNAKSIKDLRKLIYCEHVRRELTHTPDLEAIFALDKAIVGKRLYNSLSFFGRSAKGTISWTLSNFIFFLTY